VAFPGGDARSAATELEALT